MLARGDRRDFVVIDRAGDDHSLARRLGVKVAEVRARMADLDPASLPSVNEAKAQQRERQVERQQDRAAAAAQEATQRPEPVAGRETRAEAAEPSYRPPAADHGELHSPTSIVERMLRGIGRRLTDLAEAVANFIAPPPPLTKGQAELKERADEERGQAYADHAAQQERAAAQDWLVAEQQRQQQQEERLAATLGSRTASSDGNERERDRGRSL